ncbi:cell-cycle control medial ring component-domain-containing protein [Podospora didyma]|uniref:Cell-cycle control medial ring component-domain-containing protein n=1 Tax=Podospora didyma TaxID=330526 RepID=A0AAE0U149_9PEZI|nr:cell-cycle control medial ring component-domain-containing protein [Podospora didyma]
MTEVSFAKTFLGLLDTKPQKITADHVEDARNYPGSTPYTLPRMPRAMSKPTSGRGSSSNKTPGSEQRAGAPSHQLLTTVRIRSLRNPPLDITLHNQDPTTTSALDIKTAVSNETSIPVEKLKLLHSKKPVADTKALKEFLPPAPAGVGAREAATTVIELSVMVMGGAAAAVKKIAEAAPVVVDDEEASSARHSHGAAVLETEQFWTDLEGFLQQRMRDEKMAGELTSQFKGAWTAGKR